MKIFYSFLLLVFLSNPVLASSGSCSTSGSDTGYLFFTDYLGSNFKKNFDSVLKANDFNTAIMFDLDALLAANEKMGTINKDVSTFEFAHKPGCVEPLTLQDPKFNDVTPENPINVKNYSFKVSYTFDPKSEDDLDLAFKEIIVTGNILADDQCNQLMSCQLLQQVYVHEVKTIVQRVTPVGGSTSAGGIIFR
ncbi:MAG: hypothetical protein HRT44_02820 [Bdellovibrionales bacterium]|nr:hypothetical protein [Bdellovibrionales bacterium]NQZ18180.1 hypothetical protein [Bdellovibrionales bacterium]